AIIAGNFTNKSLIFFGVFFILVSSMILIGCLYVMGNVNLSDIAMDLGAGVILLVVGSGVLYLMLDKSSTAISFGAMGIFVAIPIMFVVVGIIQIIKTFYLNSKKKKKKSNKKRPLK
ncbi:MAG: hypothetical protein K2G56_04900, partial [Eubacterium sp.]|nr:hypothetical protein [Eubacterium sp.]